MLQGRQMKMNIESDGLEVKVEEMWMNAGMCEPWRWMKEDRGGEEAESWLRMLEKS